MTIVTVVVANVTEVRISRLIGAAFQRDPVTGMLSIAVAAASAVLTEIVVGTGYLGPFPGNALTDANLVPGAGGLAAIVPIVALAVSVLVTLTWLAVRNVAIRERGA